MDKLQTALTTLGYRKNWVEYGFLSVAEVYNEYDTFLRAKDKNTEHYRYRRFKRLLTTPEFFTENNIKRYIKLAKLDADLTMATSALIELACAPHLSEEQFLSLENCLPMSSALEKRYLREKNRRGLS